MVMSSSNTTIRGTVPSDDVLSTSNSAGSAIAKAAAINDATQYTGVRAIVNKTAVSGNSSIGGVTLNSENYIVINDEMITGFEVRDNDASGSLLDAINAISNKTGVSARLDEKLNLVLEAEDGRNIDVEVAGLASNLNLDMTGGLRPQTEPTGSGWQYHFAVDRSDYHRTPRPGGSPCEIGSWR